MTTATSKHDAQPEAATEKKNGCALYRQMVTHPPV